MTDLERLLELAGILRVDEKPSTLKTAFSSSAKPSLMKMFLKESNDEDYGDRIQELKRLIHDPETPDKYLDVYQTLLHRFEQKHDSSRLSEDESTPNYQELVDALNAIPHVRAAFWNKVPGKEAIYITLQNYTDRGFRPGEGGKLLYRLSTAELGGGYRNGASSWLADKSNQHYWMHEGKPSVDQIHSAISVFNKRNNITSAAEKQKQTSDQYDAENKNNQIIKLEDSIQKIKDILADPAHNQHRDLLLDLIDGYQKDLAKLKSD